MKKTRIVYLLISLMIISMAFGGFSAKYVEQDIPDPNGSMFPDGIRTHRTGERSRQIGILSPFANVNTGMDTLIDYETGQDLYSKFNRPYFILLALFHVISSCLIVIWLFNMLKDTVFSDTNKKLLNITGVIYLFLFVVDLIRYIIHNSQIMSLTRHNFIGTVYSPNLSMLTLALFFFILAQIFSVGNEIRKDQEYMV